MKADRNGVRKEAFQAKLAEYMYPQNYSPTGSLKKFLAFDKVLLLV